MTPSTERSHARQALALLLAAYAMLSVLLVGQWAPSWFYPLAVPVLTVLATAAAWLHAAGQMGPRRAWAFFALTFVVGLLLETAGVRTGWIFGPYHYTDKLGWQFFGLVPVLIPLAWFMMMYPTWLIARRWLGMLMAAPPHWLVAAVGGLIMTAWDVLMDPIMVYLGHWVWLRPGAYFGIPFHNFVGWWGMTFVTLWLFETVWKPPAPKETPAAPLRWGVLLYALVGASNLGIALRLGLVGPAVAGLWAMLPWMVVGWLSARPSAR